ncbi:uncharacterized protein FA14DRAFT_161886 [Meira miltonrushii]|uniref:S-adenosyl-L-methionine-dependent methyltransferase n=1 Tax=Meira miltonrushii TaxID=1280837 RepID=A0A316V4G4_9BASI|nr:uncharacterized protein FA14DRAFT_161886 [Meira miltonrushii]PWN32449.1 hypothetical protein FA14DRAFT_161886 [Meira miltonrushii]
MTAIYHLSFNKAPPLQVNGNDQFISIAPSIHNDLREDVYSPQDGEPLSITVAWLIESHNGNKARQLEFIEEACKISWLDGSQAYKNVQVKVPPAKLIGKNQDLHLALYVKAGEQEKAWQFDLLSDKISQSNNTVFVPALSAPIKIKGRNGGMADSRSRTLSRLFDIGLEEPIIMEEQIGFDLEGHLWDAALHMARWLHFQLNKGSRSFLSQMLHEKPSLQVLELGAGTGFVSIALSALLSDSITQSDGEIARRASILATDLMPAMEVLQQNIDHNESSRKKVDLQAAVLDWEELKKDSKEDGYDLIFVADCTYNPAYFDALCHAIQSSLHPEGICLLAKKHRHIDEGSLWDSMKKNRLSYELVHGCEATLAEDSSHAFTGWGLYKIQSM